MQYKKLGEICTKASSNIAQKDILSLEGEYPIYGASGFIKNVDFYKREEDYIAIVKDGAIGKVFCLPSKSSIIGTMQYIIPNKNIDIKYLYYALQNLDLAKYNVGAVIPHIYFRDYQNELIAVPSIEQQKKVANRLDKIETLISAAKVELAKLDELVKAKFVEMFGDPVVNDQEIPCKELPKLCEIIDGDRGKNYPTQDEFSKKGYCLFLNAKNVTAQGFNFSECMFITEERDNLLRKGKLQVGDVVLTTRGTIGNLANYNEDVPFQNVRINSGMVILRFNDIVNKVFFITQFRMKLKQIRQRIVSGTAQPQLPISTMSKMSFIIPAKDIQDNFADYVGKIDGIKSNVRKQIENLETLKKSLMKEYFG